MGGPHLPGEQEGTGPAQGVWGGDGGGIGGGTHNDSAWASGSGSAKLKYFVHGGRAADISNSPPCQGRFTELPGGWMPGPSSDEDGDAGSLSIPACPGHCSHSGGGKTPPHTVHPMQHAGPPVGTECQAPYHSLVIQKRGAKDAAASEGGAKGELGTGL